MNVLLKKTWKAKEMVLFHQLLIGRAEIARKKCVPSGNFFRGQRRGILALTGLPALVDDGGAKDGACRWSGPCPREYGPVSWTISNT
jgi:hypothetical protein